MRRGVAPIVGSQIARIEKPRSRYRPIVIAPALPTLRRRVVGKRITSVDRAGKRVVLRLETGDALLFEPRMAGLVLIADPPNREHLRLRIRLQGDGPSELLFWDRRGLGTVQLLSEEEFADGLLLGKLGPDALEDVVVLAADLLVRRPVLEGDVVGSTPPSPAPAASSVTAWPYPSTWPNGSSPT